MFQLDDYLATHEEYENIHRVYFSGINGISFFYPLLGFKDTLPHLVCDFYQSFRTLQAFYDFFPHYTLKDLDNITYAFLYTQFCLGKVSIRCMIHFDEISVSERYVRESGRLYAYGYNGKKMHVKDHLETSSDFVTFTLIQLVEEWKKNS